MANTEPLWDQVADILRPVLGPKKWQKWFAEGSVIRTERRGGYYYIGAADGWVKTTVEMYLAEVEQALFKAAGEKLNPVVVDLSRETIPDELPGSVPLASVKSFNPRYTFDSFVVGDSNRFAHAAAMAVAESPSRSYNPLFIYGGSGLGKTHLMHAIGQAVLKKDPYKKVIYISSEDFTNDFIYFLRENRMETFKAKYRNVDVLLIDDIQFMARKKETQEEFFHTFNSLHDAGKQIVISSDRHPREINPLEERLRSRFGWGLITDIQQPDWETRCAILQNKAASAPVQIDDEVIKTIADKVDTNIRDLEGALNRLVHYATLCKLTAVDLNAARQALKDVFEHDDAPRLSIPFIQHTVAEHYQITVDDLKSKRKDRDVSVPRQIAMYLCRELIGATTTQIGREFGNRHYSTVMYACEVIAAQRSQDTELERSVSELERKLRHA
ncbi:MAG: chromosomal replication initiator protein DnaA [Firmicutes bacterium]|nr:chromosomal replication initiator protein DnaA [Bacillota bacterium]